MKKKICIIFNWKACAVFTNCKKEIEKEIGNYRSENRSLFWLKIKCRRGKLRNKRFVTKSKDFEASCFLTENLLKCRTGKDQNPERNERRSTIERSISETLLTSEMCSGKLRFFLMLLFTIGLKTLETTGVS